MIHLKSGAILGTGAACVSHMLKQLGICTVSDKTWKAVNRRICRMLGGRRAGYDGEGGADCAGTEPFCVEVKHKMALPDWLKGAMLQAETYAGRSELPIAVLHEAFTDIGQSIVLVRLSDFVDWYVSQKEKP